MWFNLCTHQGTRCIEKDSDRFYTTLFNSSNHEAIYLEQNEWISKSIENASKEEHEERRLRYLALPMTEQKNDHVGWNLQKDWLCSQLDWEDPKSWSFWLKYSESVSEYKNQIFEQQFLENHSIMLKTLPKSALTVQEKKRLSPRLPPYRKRQSSV